MFNKIKNQHDCSTKKCKNDEHGNIITAAITKRMISDDKLGAFIAKTCKNFTDLLDNESNTPLQMAAATGRYAIAEWLINNGANVNIKNKNTGRTPLHSAIYHGNINIAVLLLRYGTHLDIFDNEYKYPLQHCCSLMEYNSNYVADMFETLVWGCNKNNNLGIGNEDGKLYPQNLEFFQKQNVTLQDISISTYHSMFLDTKGNVYTVGHGKGGRLGISMESSLVFPKKVELSTKNSNEIAINISAAKNHSLILTNMNNIYASGLNTHNQLGFQPPAPDKLTNFKEIVLISPHIIDKPKFRNIIARDYHSIAITDNDIYVWGLNGGQFGFKGTTENIFPTKLETYGNKLLFIESSNATIACCTNSQLILLYNKFKIKSLKKPSYENIRSIAVKGGDFITSNATISKPENIQLIVLTASAALYIWYEDTQKYIKCTYNIPIIDTIQWFKEDVIISSYGDLFNGILTKQSIKSGCNSNSKYNDDENYRETGVKRDICTSNKIVIDLKRIPNANRVTKIKYDQECSSFILLQEHSRNYLQIPILIDEEFHLKNLLIETTDDDDVHDIVFHVEDDKFLAHKFIVFSRAPGLQDIVNQFDTKDIYLKYEFLTSKMFEFMLRYIYCNHVLTMTDVEDIETSVMAYRDLSNLDIYSKFREYAGKFGLAKFATSVKLSSKDIDGGKRFKKLNRNSFPSLYDITIICANDIEIKAHKCILIGRMEYFRLMFKHSWVETKSVNFPTVPVEYMQTIIDYLYTNDVNYIKNQKFNEKYLYQMLTICDQFFINRLRNIFEILVLEKISIRKCSEMLEFALYYNCKLLEKSSLDFICQNMGRVLENHCLDDLDNYVLEKINVHYKKMYPIFDYRIITPDPNAISDCDLENFIHDFTIDLNYRCCEDNAKKNDYQKKIIKPSRMTQNRKNYERDGIQILHTVFKEEEQLHSNNNYINSNNNNNNNGGDSQQIQLNNNGLSTDQKIWKKVQDNRKDNHDKKKLILAGLHSNAVLKGESVKKFEFTNLNNIVNSGSTFNNCTEICQQQQQQRPSTSKNIDIVEQSSLTSYINFGDFTPQKFDKLSQKQRKRQVSESSVANHIVTSSPPLHDEKLNKNGESLSLNSSPAQSWSFANVMKSPSASDSINFKVNIITIPPVVESIENITNQMKSKSSASPTANASSSSSSSLSASSSPLNLSKSPKKSTSSTPENFLKILKNEKKQKEYYEKLKRKSLHLTQTEESAIDELKTFYNVDNVFDECILIDRQTVEMTPTLNFAVWQNALTNNK